MCKIAQTSPGSSQLLFIQSFVFEMNNILCLLRFKLTEVWKLFTYAAVSGDSLLMCRSTSPFPQADFYVLVQVNLWKCLFWRKPCISFRFHLFSWAIAVSSKERSSERWLGQKGDCAGGLAGGLQHTENVHSCQFHFCTVLQRKELPLAVGQPGKNLWLPHLSVQIL